MSVDDVADRNEVIRLKILDYLYKNQIEKPGFIGVDRDTLLSYLGEPENLVDFNILYLEEKELLELYKVIGSLWKNARLTAFGTDVIENKDKYSDEFPFLQITVQEIHGDVYGDATQAVESQIQITKVESSFNKARELIQQKNIPKEKKDEINEHLTTLEEEIEKEDPDAGVIQQSWQWIKRNASWVVPILSSIILETTKKIIL